MDVMIEKVKGALRACLSEEATCDGCAYSQEVNCIDSRNRETLEVITLLEEQNKELREANSRLVAQMKDARAAVKEGVPPMPCNVGDPLWSVIEEEGMISVTKTVCKALLWDGESWMISDDDCLWEIPDEEALFLSIEAAVKRRRRCCGMGTMREILFRGKRLDNGEWVEGLLLITVPGKVFIVNTTEEEGCGLCTEVFDRIGNWEVGPATVGQYTGLTANGKRIFEGDIVNGLFLFEQPIAGEVTFRDGSFGVQWMRGRVEEFSAFTSCCNVAWEVIGNVADNPELLEGGVNDE